MISHYILMELARTLKTIARRYNVPAFISWLHWCDVITPDWDLSIVYIYIVMYGSHLYQSMTPRGIMISNCALSLVRIIML